MPGLIDVHTHLAYGNAKSEEDIDLYSPLEFRTLRGMFFAQKCAAAGLHRDLLAGRRRADQPVDPQRDPRRAVRRPARHGRRALHHDASGPDRLVPDLDRRADHLDRPARHQQSTRRSRKSAGQVKNGVDCVKIAIDGIQRRPDGELIAAFTQEETDAMVREIHRLGRKAVAHAVGREATLYSARAGIDLIFHGFDLDDECIAAMMKSGSMLCPTLTQPQQRHRVHPAARAGGAEGPPRGDRARATGSAVANLKKAVAAGMPFLTGTDTRFRRHPLRRMACPRA